MKRVGAVVGAVAMVVVAILIRGAIDDDGGGDDASGSLELVCATELRQACEELDVDVTIEPAGTTYQQLVAVPDADLDDLGIDGWLTLSPWPEMVDAERARLDLAPVFDPPTGPIARSPLVVAVRTEREGVLTEACEGPIRWPCLGDQARRRWDDLPGGEASWGTVRVGHADPTTSAAGLLVLGQATTEYFGDRTDLSTNNDLDAPGSGFFSWLTNLEGSQPVPTFQTFLTTPTFDAVGTTEAEAGPALAASRPDIQESVSLIYLEPVVTADVVFAATAGGGDAGASLERAVTDDGARAALAESGWRVDGEDRADGVADSPALPDASGLPSAELLYILQQRWIEVT